MLSEFIYDHFMESEVLTTEEHEVLIQCSKRVLEHLKKHMEKERDQSLKEERARNIAVVEHIIENHQLHLKYSDKHLPV